MENRKTIFGRPNFSTLFSTMPFDKVLDSLAKANLLEAKRIEQKKQILTIWFFYVKKGQEE
jgi:hypothetical protein